MIACKGEDTEVVASVKTGSDAAEGIQLAFTTSTAYQADTRMSREDTQADGQYRGIDYLRFIPFGEDRDVQLSDVSLKSIVRYYVSDRYLQFEEHLKYEEVDKFYDKLDVSRSLLTALSVPSGTKSFLIYGRPNGGGEHDTSANKFAMGSLIPSSSLDDTDYVSASDITFSPDKIYSTGSSDQISFDAAMEIAEGEGGIVDYMNYLAQITYQPVSSSSYIPWYNAPVNSFAHELFLKFIHGEGFTFTLGNNQLPALLTDIYDSMLETQAEIAASSDPSAGAESYSLNTLISAFIERADGSPEEHPYHDKIHYDEVNRKFNALGSWENFPLTAGLPNGMFVFKWISNDNDKHEFVLLNSANTKLNDENNLTMLTPRILDPNTLAFPAQLWYFDNSTLHTSDTEFTSDELSVILSDNPWSEINLDRFYDNAVQEKTKSVIIDKPINYGVSRLEVNAKMNAAPLVHIQPDGTEYRIVADAIQLKGIMVTHQHTAGFDFQPVDYNFNVIYDNHIMNNRPNGGRPFTLSPNIFDRNKINVLTLPSHLNEEVFIIAEFCLDLDNIDEELWDKPIYTGNCEIYPNTPFYMVGKLDPREVSVELNDNPRQVFISDKVTKVQLRLSTLEGAYNYVPDVRTPSLILGLDVITDWQQAEPETIWLE